jgi:hypothetical protein
MKTNDLKELSPLEQTPSLPVPRPGNDATR